MPHFNKRLEAQGTYLTFYFNSLYTAEGLRYHVSVVDKNRKTNAFQMKESESKWMLVNPDNCPDWITAVEGKLGEVISSHIDRLV